MTVNDELYLIAASQKNAAEERIKIAAENLLNNVQRQIHGCHDRSVVDTVFVRNLKTAVDRATLEATESQGAKS